MRYRHPGLLSPPVLLLVSRSKCFPSQWLLLAIEQGNGGDRHHEMSSVSSDDATKSEQSVNVLPHVRMLILLCSCSSILGFRGRFARVPGAKMPRVQTCQAANWHLYSTKRMLSSSGTIG